MTPSTIKARPKYSATDTTSTSGNIVVAIRIPDSNSNVPTITAATPLSQGWFTHGPNTCRCLHGGVDHPERCARDQHDDGGQCHHRGVGEVERLGVGETAVQ